jgi:triosephosphate isomerase
MARLGVIAQDFDIYEGDGLDGFARTGAISLDHIQKAGAQGVILGHSETRDSPEVINLKLHMLARHRAFDKTPFGKIIVLVGETWEEFESSSKPELAELLKGRCKTILAGIPKPFLSNLILGYEPKWGSRRSGRKNTPPPEPAVISACIKEMRRFIREKYGKTPYFIYGGRSTPGRAKEIMKDENIDGLLLGSACSTIRKTLEIANAMQEDANRKKLLVCNFKAYDLADPYEKYIAELCKLPEDFSILLAPPYTDIRAVRAMIEEKNVLLD